MVEAVIIPALAAVLRPAWDCGVDGEAGMEGVYVISFEVGWAWPGEMPGLNVELKGCDIEMVFERGWTESGFG